MDDVKRYGLYVVPQGALYRAGADWLGWDSVARCAVAQPDLPGLPDTPAALTATPRKYGFHGTIKPPFRPRHGYRCQRAGGRGAQLLRDPLPGHDPRARGSAAGRVHRPCVRRALRRACRSRGGHGRGARPVPRAPSEAELARRRKSPLTDRQEALLARWGYPYVMEEFRFHMTLTGNLPSERAEAAHAALAAHFTPHLAAPFVIDSLCLMGEDAAGMFHLLHRYTFAG